MSVRLIGWICRIAYALGISVAAYNAVRVSQIYKSVRDYGTQIAATNDVAAYALALQKSPESVDAQILTIFIGFALMVLSEYFWKKYHIHKDPGA